MAKQEIRFKVSLDDSGVPQAGKRTEESLVGIDKASGKANAAMLAFGEGGKLTARQLQALSYQTSDIVTQLAGGQNPLLILLQQGGQLRDQFGGLGNVFSAVRQAVTPTGLAFGALAATIGAVALAAYEGAKDVRDLESALALTGNAAGVTRAQVDAMARRLADATATSVNDTRDTLTGLARTGAFVGSNLELAGRAALAMSRLTGESREAAVKGLSAMRDGVTQWAGQASKAYNIVSAETYRHIQALEAQGRTQEAVTLALSTFAETAEKRTEPALNALGKALQTVAKHAGDVWDRMKDIAKSDTLEQQLSGLQARLAASMNRAGEASRYNALTGRMMPGGDEQIRDIKAQIAAIQAAIATRDQKIAEQKDAAEKNAKDILESQRGYVDARLALQAAGDQRSFELQRLNLETIRSETEQSYRDLLISASSYEESIIAIERASSEARIKLADKALARERDRVATSPEQTIAKQAAIVQAQVAVLRAMGERDKLEADIRNGKFKGAARNVLEDPAAAFRQSEAQASAAIEQAWGERVSRNAEGLRDLAQANRNMGIELIRDERARGLAVIAADEETMRKRLDLAVLNGDDRRQAEEQLMQWRMLREQQLTEQLKPQWQRDADLWGDTLLDMRRRYDEFLGGFVNSGRDAFMQWAQEGRITTSGLASFIRAEFAKLVYERYLSGYVRQVGAALFDMFIGGGRSGGSGMPDNVPTRGGRAWGGPVDAHSAYLVGERGPEVLVMGRSPGVVIPNAATVGGGGIHITQVFQVNPGQDAGTLRALANMARQSALDGVVDARRRGVPGFVGG